MASYVADVSGWEGWQRDYRLGVLLIIPPEEVRRRIDPLRARHDPRSHAICPTHISVSSPLQHEMTPEVAGEIAAALSPIGPFTLHFSRLHASPDRGSVAYPIRPLESIEALRTALHATSAFAGQVHGRRHIPPHMTIAESISVQDSLELCAQLQDTAPSGSFLCDRLEYMVPDEAFRFRRLGTFPLGMPRPASSRRS